MMTYKPLRNRILAAMDYVDNNPESDDAPLVKLAASLAMKSIKSGAKEAIDLADHNLKQHMKHVGISV